MNRRRRRGLPVPKGAPLSMEEIKKHPNETLSPRKTSSPLSASHGNHYGLAFEVLNLTHHIQRLTGRVDADRGPLPSLTSFRRFSM
jgi:hypothetical protein